MFIFKNGITESNYHNYVPAAFSEAPKHTTSDRYLYVPTYKLVERLKKEGFEVVGARQNNGIGDNRLFAKHQVYLTHKSFDQKNWLVGEERAIAIIDNSHDGTSRLKMMGGFWRKWCANGAIMPVGKNSTELSVVHRIGMEREVTEAAYKMIEVYPKYVQDVVEMKQIGLKHEEKVFMAEAAANLLWEPEKLELNKKQGINLAHNLLEVRRSEDRKNDLWTTFNVIQENVIKGGQRTLTQSEAGRISRQRSRPVEAIDRNTKLNQELMTLALKMRELKTGAQA